MEYVNALHEEISAVWKIFTTAQESFLFAKYFSEKQNSKDSSPFKSQNFRYIQRIMFKDSVIELFKIYSNGDRTSIEKIKTKIKKKEYNIEIDNKVFTEISQQISINKTTIEKIELNRSKRFAHFEEEKEVDPLFLGDIENLLESTKKIILTTYHLCFDSQTEFRPLYFDARHFNKIETLYKNDIESSLLYLTSKSSK